MVRGLIQKCFVGFVAVAAVIGSVLGFPGDAAAQTPSGTIYYKSGTAFYAIKPDGTGKASNILPNIYLLSGPAYGIANPAYSPSGGNAIHDRWFIYTANTGSYDEYVNSNGTVSYDEEHRDLFAVRSNPQDRSQLITVQLTDLYGIVKMFPAASCWSNDGNNSSGSFVTGWAYDLRDAYSEEEDPETGEITTVLRAADQISISLRLPLTSSELNSGWLDGTLEPVSPDTVSEAELDEMLWPSMRGVGRIDKQGALAPDGTRFLRTFGPQTQVQIMDAASETLVQLLWDGSTSAPNVMQDAQWSPNGQTIVIGDRDASLPSGGNIWTQPASGASPPKKVLSSTVSGSTKIAYSNPIWSPDNNYVVVLKQRYSGSTLNGAWITRVKVSDGKTLDLTAVSTVSGVGSQPVRWVSN